MGTEEGAERLWRGKREGRREAMVPSSYATVRGEERGHRKRLIMKLY